MTADAGVSAGEPRDFVKYTFLHLDPAWRLRSRESRRGGRWELAALLAHPPPGMHLQTYSLVGTKGGADGLLWIVAESLESIQELHARLYGTSMGRYLAVAFSYLGLGRRSEYLGDHAHGGQEGAEGRRRPVGRPYLFVYPFVKKREWYGLPFEERRRIMGEHFRIGHKFPRVVIHTGYSFGLDDAEFILGFEADSPAEFLDLVEALRGSEASRYTALETPIFTCRRVPPLTMLELADGVV
ncbi:MAG: chlorite dismutase family protein [Thermoplasmata archaeon]|nr:chlorite dismutase family protein [Thermoplasmata archaeon]